VWWGKREGQLVSLHVLVLVHGCGKLSRDRSYAEGVCIVGRLKPITVVNARLCPCRWAVWLRLMQAYSQLLCAGVSTQYCLLGDYRANGSHACCA